MQQTEDIVEGMNARSMTEGEPCRWREVSRPDPLSHYVDSFTRPSFALRGRGSGEIQTPKLCSHATHCGQRANQIAANISGQLF